MKVPPGLQCVGYKEFFTVERGECSFDEAVETIKRNTRRYAKRQTTWFWARNREGIIDYCDDDSVLKDRIEKAMAF